MTGKWNADQRNDWNVTQIDNRDAKRIDVTDEYYHEKYDTISCPHCGCTLWACVVMPFHYCYICGGQFGERKITYTEEVRMKSYNGLTLHKRYMNGQKVRIDYGRTENN